MAPIVTSIDVARPPEEVFGYVIDPSRFVEWQEGVVSGRMEGDGPHGVGSRCITTRRIGGSDRASTQEITEFDPPRTWADRGIDGPIRARVNVKVEPLHAGASSRVTISLDFEGHGIGKLLVPLVVRRQAQAEMPANCQRLKERLEAGAAKSLRKREGERDR
jgi:uncharacterized protein YndB with AHSA1/START domain